MWGSKRRGFLQGTVPAVVAALAGAGPDVWPDACGKQAGYAIWIAVLLGAGIYFYWLVVRVPIRDVEGVLRLLHYQMQPEPSEKLCCSLLVPRGCTRRKDLRVVASVEDGRFVRRKKTVRAGTGTAGRAFTTNDEWWVDDLFEKEKDFFKAQTAWAFRRDEAAELRQDRVSYWSFPLIVGGKVRAVICIDSARPRVRTDARRGFVVPPLVALLADVLQLNQE